MGLNLFIRDRHGVHITAVGYEFLTYAKSVLAETEKLKQFVYDANGYEVGTLTIGTYTSICAHWLPEILEGFEKDHPMITIKLKDGGIQEIDDWLKHRDIDLALCSRQNNTDFQFITLRQDPLLAVLPKTHPLASSATEIPVQLFNSESSILPEAMVDCDIHNLLQANHIRPKIRYTAKDNYAIMAMVEHSLGISIIPQLALAGSRHDFITLPLSPKFYRELGICMVDIHKLSPIAKKFLWYVQDFFGNETKNE